MSKCRKLIFIAIIGILSIQTAKADRPFTEPEEYLKANKLVGEAKQLLFQMSYAAQPVCRSDKEIWQWSLGPWPKTVPKNQSDKDIFKSVNEFLAKKYQIEPGASIYLGSVDQIPLGYAGFKAETPFELVMKLEDRLSFYGIGPMKEASKRLAIQEEKFGANPWEEFEIKLNGGSKKIRAKRVPICTSNLDLYNSEYMYAESIKTTVIVSLPLLERLSRKELIAVLSHEMAQVALKLSWRDQPSALARIFIPRLVTSIRDLGTNAETNTRTPDDEEMIKADRLAMRIAFGFGLSVNSYVTIVGKLIEEGSPGRPAYGRTRGIGREREAALKQSVELWNTSKEFLPVPGVSEEILSEVVARATLARKNPAYAFGDGAEGVVSGLFPDEPDEYSGPSAKKIETPIVVESQKSSPQSVEAPSDTASSFANIDDISAIPYVDDKVREQYQKWLKFAAPKAFAISVSGAYSYASGTSPTDSALSADPSERVLVLCNRLSSTPCRLYAVNQSVVWTKPTADEMKELSARLPHVSAMPVPSGFAAVDDVNAVPKLGAKGKELYQEWLTKPFPRAVAISDKGAIARGYGSQAMQQAVRTCERLFSDPCRLYAVDDQVVWKKE